MLSGGLKKRANHLGFLMSRAAPDQRRFEREVARDISYAHSAQTKAGQTMIKLMENATGRINLIKRARGYGEEVQKGRSFWDVMVERYGLSLNIQNGSLSNIPSTGPLILIANHPYGILDGLMLGYILATVRGDFRILAHQVFRKAEELNKVIIPVSFDETKDAVKSNLQSRKLAVGYLARGGAIGIFPGGTVSTSVTPFAKPMDPAWRSFTARMIAKSNATVVPIHFEGHASRLFQVASHLHYTLRMGLLIKEFKKRVDGPVDISIGSPIPTEEIAKRASDPRLMMQFLRQQTYALSSQKIDPNVQGFEFEDHYKSVAQ